MHVKYIDLQHYEFIDYVRVTCILSENNTVARGIETKCNSLVRLSCKMYLSGNSVDNSFITTILK